MSRFELPSSRGLRGFLETGVSMRFHPSRFDGPVALHCDNDARADVRQLGWEEERPSNLADRTRALPRSVVAYRFGEARRLAQALRSQSLRRLVERAKEYPNVAATS